MRTSPTLNHLLSNPISSLTLRGVYPTLDNSKKFCNLDYDQIEAKSGDQIVEECRGLVICKPDGSEFKSDFSDFGEFIVCCRPMKRFYNYGTGGAAVLDYTKVYYMEKLDGSCTKVWWDHINSEWVIGTRGTAKAHVKIGGMHKDSEFTFTTLFKTIVKDFSSFVQELDKEYTYLFELCSQWNQVVVNYPEAFISLLAVIHTKTGQEKNIWNLPESTFYSKVKRYEISTFEEIFSFLEKVDPTKFEGFVVMDDEFNRIKVKHPGYNSLNAMRVSFVSTRNIVESILLGTIDDAMCVVSPSIKEDCEKIIQQVSDYIRENEEVWQELKTKGLSRKEFAVLCQERELPLSWFMNLYVGKFESFKDAFVLAGKTKQGTYSDSYLDTIYSLVSK